MMEAKRKITMNFFGVIVKKRNDNIYKGENIMSLLTKNAISNAFLELSSKKSIDKITVKDIVGVCGITRQTFYYHFQDIMDVIEWSLQQKMEELLRKSLEAESMLDAIRILVSTVEDYPEILNKLMNSRKREPTEGLLLDTMKAYMREMIDRKELFMDMNRSDMEMALSFYSFAIVGVLLDISQKRKPVDLELISKQIYLLITGQMFKSQV